MTSHQLRGAGGGRSFLAFAFVCSASRWSGWAMEARASSASPWLFWGSSSLWVASRCFGTCWSQAIGNGRCKVTL